jgi:DnaJ-like protein/PilZ domain-containing protein
MSTEADYYRVLQVRPDASPAAIHASYRALLSRSGADRNLRALLDEAYAVLSSIEKRAAYDLQRDIAASQRLRAPNFDAADADERTGRFGASRCLFCGALHGLQRRLDANDECSDCSSPLYPAERHRLEYSGQRMLRRTPSRREILYYVGWPQTEPFVGEMRDLSLNGMLFAAKDAVTLNQVIKIDSDVCRALARVAHCERDAEHAERWAIGVEFLTLRFRRNRGSFVSARA